MSLAPQPPSMKWVSRITHGNTLTAKVCRDEIQRWGCVGVKQVLFKRRAIVWRAIDVMSRNCKGAG